MRQSSPDDPFPAVWTYHGGWANTDSNFNPECLYLPLNQLPPLWLKAFEKFVQEQHKESQKANFACLPLSSPLPSPQPVMVNGNEAVNGGGNCVWPPMLTTALETRQFVKNLIFIKCHTGPAPSGNMHFGLDRYSWGFRFYNVKWSLRADAKEMLVEGFVSSIASWTPVDRHCRNAMWSRRLFFQLILSWIFAVNGMLKIQEFTPPPSHHPFREVFRTQNRSPPIITDEGRFLPQFFTSFPSVFVLVLSVLFHVICFRFLLYS